MIHDLSLLNIAPTTPETMTNNGLRNRCLSRQDELLPYPEPECRRHGWSRCWWWCWFLLPSWSFRCPRSKRCRCPCTSYSPFRWGTSRSSAVLHCRSCWKKKKHIKRQKHWYVRGLSMPQCIELSALLYLLNKTISIIVIKMSLFFPVFFPLYVQFPEREWQGVCINAGHNPNIWYVRMTHFISNPFYMNFILMDWILWMIDVSL